MLLVSLVGSQLITSILQGWLLPFDLSSLASLLVELIEVSDLLNPFPLLLPSLLPLLNFSFSFDFFLLMSLRS